MKKTLLNLALLLLLFSGYAHVNAQWLPEIWLKGNYIEVGLSDCGSLGGDVSPPPGYHPNSPLPGIGFVVDIGKNGWSTPDFTSYGYCGDYFARGEAVEGWALTFDGVDRINSASWVCTEFDIPGTATAIYYSAGEDSATWEGDVAGMHVRQRLHVPKDSLYFRLTVTLINTTADTMMGVYYGRNAQTENERPWTDDSVTINKVHAQPGGGSDLAYVSATGTGGGCYFGMGADDPRARVNTGGFGTPPADDLYYSVGRTDVVGTVITADEAIGIGFNLGNLLPGDSTSLAIGYVIDSASMASALLRVSPCSEVSSSFTATACESYNFGGTVLTSSGTYLDTLMSVCGFDSIVTLGLTINDPSSSSETVTACDEYLFGGSLLSASGIYTIMLTNAAGCDSTVTLDLTIDNIASTAVIFTSGTLIADAFGLSYQWVDCDLGYSPIAGATSQSFTPLADGHYAVVLTSGSCTDTSACTEVLVTAMQTAEVATLNIYPNPAENRVEITLSPAHANMSVQIVNTTGQVMWEKSFSNQTSVSADISSLAPGVYFVKARSGEMERVVKVLKM